MEHGFIKVAAVTPKVRVADPSWNAEQVIEGLDDAGGEGCEDRGISGALPDGIYLRGPVSAGDTAAESEGRSEEGGGAYRGNGYAGLCRRAARAGRKTVQHGPRLLQNGSILAFVPKRFIPNYSEFYEMRHYTPGGRENTEILFEGQTVPFGSRILFDIDAVEGLSVAAELCEGRLGGGCTGYRAPRSQERHSS
jgi:NAD+ synthase (glutamine-hydrolysing)